MNKIAGENKPPWVGSSIRDQVGDPLGFFLKLTRNHGDIVQYRSAPEPAYFINHPDYIKHVLLANGRNYNKDTYLNKYILSTLTGKGLLTSEGELWRRQRHLIQPAFHRRSLVKFEKLMTQASEKMLKKWASTAKSAASMDISNEMMQLTLDIVTQSLFGYDISEHAKAVGQAVDTLIKYGKPRHREVKEAIKILDEIVYGIIDKARQNPMENRDDLLSMMLQARYEDTGEGMSDQQLRDEVMSLFIAGHETTANTLSWLWWLVAQHPEVWSKLEEEVKLVLNGRMASVTDFPKLIYTKMVVEESMRLYPSAWTISRRSIEDDEIGGYHIPANSIIAMSPFTMHRHPDFWQDPEIFDPYRFTPDSTTARPRFAYFPFGGGARRCIGEHFAMMENMIIVPAIVQKFRLHLIADHLVEPHALVTLRPRHGILMTIESYK